MFVLCQWNDEKEQLEETLSDLQHLQENSEQWQRSIDQIKEERNKVNDVDILSFVLIFC